MSAFIIFFCTGLLIYWTSRTRILLHGSPAAIEATLESDLLRGRRFLSGLRALVLPTVSDMAL